jgi:hypothetical protein
VLCRHASRLKHHKSVVTVRMQHLLDDQVLQVLIKPQWNGVHSTHDDIDGRTPHNLFPSVVIYESNSWKYQAWNITTNGEYEAKMSGVRAV